MTDWHLLREDMIFQIFPGMKIIPEEELFPFSSSVSRAFVSPHCNVSFWSGNYFLYWITAFIITVYILFNFHCI